MIPSSYRFSFCTASCHISTKYVLFIKEVHLSDIDIRGNSYPPKMGHYEKSLIGGKERTRMKNSAETIARKTFNRGILNLHKAIFSFPKASFGPIDTKKADSQGVGFSFALQRYNIGGQIPNSEVNALSGIVRERESFVFFKSLQNE